MLVCLLKISWSFDNFPPFTTRTPLQIMKVYNNNLFLSKCQTTPNTIGRIKMFGSWLSHAQDCVHKHANGHLSQPHFWKSVRMKFTLPKWGLGSPLVLLKFQSSIARVKTFRIMLFFISLESYWNVDVENGLTWAIWTSATQVMAKRKAGSQIGSLTLDH
jgi:hypothetical protein